MPRQLMIGLSLFLTMLPGLPSLAAESLQIDPSHTAIVFSWNHRGLSHPVARLEKIHGNVLLDASDMAKSSVSVTLPLDGLRTGDDLLDKRLKGAEFFDANNFPAITFTSTNIEAAGGNALKITGDLSVHGITKSVVLNATINKIIVGPDHKLTAGFDAEVMLRRSDFGVSRYVPMTSDELSVHITLEAGQE
jgi:polyisoprenoid-binding protein YceI